VKIFEEQELFVREYLEKLRALFIPHLNEGEEITHFFPGAHIPSFWWFFLFGPFIILGSRCYGVALTARGVHLQRLDLFFKPEVYNFFQWHEISEVKFGRKFFLLPCLRLTFANRRRVVICTMPKFYEILPHPLFRLPKINAQIRAFVVSKGT